MTQVSPATSRRSYEDIVDVLGELGVRETFGLMGEDTASLITDLQRLGIAYYAAMHENVAVTMASGYAWATQGLGVAFVSRGPGLANAATALGSAVAEGLRLLVITGEIPVAGGAGGADLKSKLSQRALCAALGVDYRTAVNSEQLISELRSAIGSAQRGRTVVLAVPVDVMEGEANSQTSEVAAAGEPGGVVTAAGAEIPRPSREDIAAVASLLARSSRPFILAGRGAVRAGARDDLIALAQRSGALLGTSLMGKDLFRGHTYDFGLVGGCTTDAGVRLLDEVDCVVVFGAGLNFFTTANGTLFDGIPVVQFDADPDALTGRFLALERGVVGDAKVAAQDLLAALESHPVAAHPLHDEAVLTQLPTLTRFGDDSDVSTSEAIDPRLLVAALDEMLPAARTVVSDGGHSVGFPMMHLRVPGPSDYLLPVMGVGAIGMGLGSAIGVSLARADRQTVFFVGDGTLAMTMGDLAPLARYGIPLIVVVLNDQAYGAERHILDLHQKPPAQAMFPDTDFAGVARALGIESATVRTIDDLRAQSPAVSTPRERPLLLDCKITPELRAAWIEEMA